MDSSSTTRERYFESNKLYFWQQQTPWSLPICIWMAKLLNSQPVTTTSSRGVLCLRSVMWTGIPYKTGGLRAPVQQNNSKYILFCVISKRFVVIMMNRCATVTKRTITVKPHKSRVNRRISPRGKAALHAIRNQSPSHITISPIVTHWRKVPSRHRRVVWHSAGVDNYRGNPQSLILANYVWPVLFLVTCVKKGAARYPSIITTWGISVPSNTLAASLCIYTDAIVPYTTNDLAWV